ncbi:MAG: ABC transporter permease, partial [Promethearchaeota archaeon]
MKELVEFNTRMRLAVIWVLAKREIYAFWRNKTRIISSFVQGLMFLIVFSGGFSSFRILIQGVQIGSGAFIASGICAMTILFSGIFGGMGVMRDKMFGFMKELIVAPIRRQILMIGRTTGVALQTLIQSLIIFFISVAIGYFGYDWSLIWRVLLYIPVALLSSLGIVGLGLTIGSKMS